MKQLGFQCDGLPIEIDAEEPTVDAILSKLREKIEIAKRSPKFSQTMSELNSAIKEFESEKYGPSETQQNDFKAPVTGLIEHQNLATNKKIIGSIIMKLHRVADTEVHWLLEPTLVKLTEMIGGLSGDVNSLKTTQMSEIEKVNKQIGGLSGDVNSLKTTQMSEIEKVNKQIGGLSGDVNSLKTTQMSEIEKVNKQIGGLSGDVNSLKTTQMSEIEKVNKQIGRLSGDVDSLRSPLQADIAQLKSRVDSLDGRLAKKQHINYAVTRVADGFVVNERIIENAFAIRSLPEEIKRILDVGCCESDLSIQLATMGFDVYGIDSKNYELTHRNFHFIRDDISHTSFQDGYFDAVLAISAVEHIGLGHYGDSIYSGGDLKSMREIHRILRNGGTLIMSTPFGAKARVTWQRVYDNDSLANLLKEFNVQKADYWLKEGEEWRIASLNEAKLQDHDIKPFGGTYPLWPCIVTLIATKPIGKSDRPAPK